MPDANEPKANDPLDIFAILKRAGVPAMLPGMGLRTDFIMIYYADGHVEELDLTDSRMPLPRFRSLVPCPTRMN